MRPDEQVNVEEIGTLMVLFLLLAMIGVPILEIAVFIQAGEAFGLWPTLVAVVATAIAGTALLRIQGLSALLRVQAGLKAGRIPLAGLFDGLCLLVAGALLLTPGFITDGIGMLLFVPPFRAVLRRLLARRLAAHGHVENWHADVDLGGTVIDDEFQEVQPDDEGPPPRIPS
jgi:UPF0716 protein FxsA